LVCRELAPAHEQALLRCWELDKEEGRAP
jgi:hypothetical protein